MGHGHSHHSGFTTTLTPNTDVVFVDNGVTYRNTDYASRQEGSHSDICQLFLHEFPEAITRELCNLACAMARYDPSVPTLIFEYGGRGNARWWRCSG